MIKAKKTFEIDYIDPSSISTFSRCPAKYYFSRILGLEKRIEGTSIKHLAMNYGTDIHEAVPYCYGNEKELDFAINLFKARWEKRGHEFNDKRNIDTAERTLIEFWGSHKNCPYKIEEYPISAPTKSDVSKNEVPFLIDIGGKLPLAGRIDAPVTWKTDGTLWALDYKTSGEVSNRLFENFENAPQALGYTLALSMIAHKRATGFIIEAIRVSKTNAESQMHHIFIKDCQIEQFINAANRLSEHIIKCNEKKEWPMCLGACSTYPGFGQPGYACEYLDICTNPDKDAMISFYDKGERYHPFLIDKEEVA